MLKLQLAKCFLNNAALLTETVPQLVLQAPEIKTWDYKQSHLLHIPQQNEMLQACKHELVGFAQSCGIYPWPASPFEGSGFHMQYGSQL